MERMVNFSIKYYRLAKNAGAKFNVSWIVILAQAALESGFGESFGARNRKNFFGITAYGSKNEYWDGSQSTASTGLKFRIYKTDQDSFYDFARLISTKYTTAASLSNDYKAYAKAIAYSPYISESNGDNRPVYQNSIIKYSEIILKNLSEIQKKKPDPTAEQS